MTLRDRINLWLIRHRLRACPSCLGARMVHHFGGGEFAELRRCWTCTGSNAYLAETRAPAVTVAKEPTPLHLRAV